VIFPPEGNGPYRLLRALGGAPVDRFERALDHPERAQADRLAVVLAATAGSTFGAAHGLGGAPDLDRLRAAVPIRTHADFLPWLDRVEAGEPGVLTTDRVLQLVQTTGTTGRPKRVPVTRAWADSVATAQRLWVLGLLRDDEALAGGAALSVVSPAVAGHTTGGLPYGSNTGRMFLEQPFWVRWRAPVPWPVYLLDDPETRQYAILRHALAADVRSWTAANPSTILLYRRRLQAWWEELCRDLHDGTLRRTGARRLARRRLSGDPAWPWALRRVCCWLGGPAAFFAARVPAALGADVPIREAGLSASEGYFAVPVDDGDPVAWLHGHVLEFVGADGQPRWAWEVEAGSTYRLVVTTEAGLVRYDMGDLVRVTGFVGRTPRLVFAGRAGAELSAVGERVTESQLLAAVAAACPAATHVSAAIVWAEVPRLDVILGVPEGAAPPADTLAAALDTALRRENVEYADRRESGRYAPLRARLLPERAWARWRDARVAGGAPEAQLKEPVVLDTARLAELVHLAEAPATPDP
jgi:acyl-CoA synthetase (AMP-forming)/AMP-acid ligase II